MRVTCQAFLVLIAAGIACSDPVTPNSISGLYELESVNGKPLPAVISPVGEETIAVIYGGVILTPDAVANTYEIRREVRQNVSGEHPYRGTFRFVLDGNKIGFIIDCPINANCISLEGTIIGRKLRIALGGFSSPNALIYDYRYEARTAATPD